MLPEKCSECGREIGFFFVMTKEEKSKSGVCPDCKKKLEKDGWKVIGTGLY